MRRGGITKAGTDQLRHMLVETALTYRNPSRVGKAKLYRLEQTHLQFVRSPRALSEK